MGFLLGFLLASSVLVLASGTRLAISSASMRDCKDPNQVALWQGPELRVGGADTKVA